MILPSFRAPKNRAELSLAQRRPSSTSSRIARKRGMLPATAITSRSTQKVCSCHQRAPCWRLAAVVPPLRAGCEHDMHGAVEVIEVTGDEPRFGSGDGSASCVGDHHGEG